MESMQELEGQHEPVSIVGMGKQSPDLPNGLDNREQRH